MHVMYNTSLGVIFGVKKYAATLAKIAEERYILVKLNSKLSNRNNTIN